jgi:glycosyltransferase involved in cell wall biosynthesis
MLGTFHQRLWKRLPRRARRSALFSFTRLAAPKPDSEAKPAEPLIVVGCLRSATGLGESARLCYEALHAAGLDVYGIDVSSVLMQPLDVPDFAFRDARSFRGSGTLLAHVNAPLLPLILMSLGRQLIRNKWVVGYWAWELPAIPAEWECGLPFVHEIWVPSRFVASAVAGSTTSPIRVLPHAVARDGHLPIASRRKRNGSFTALVMFDMGSSMARKNPISAISAFRNAFGDRKDCRMIVKVTNGGLFTDGETQLRAAIAGADNVTLIDRTLPRCELSQVYEQADCLISLHRSEGFGLTVAEAMLHAVPAVATDWSGTTDFVTEETGCPVQYHLVPARDPQGTYDCPEMDWAEPDIATAARALQRLRDEPSGLGEKARDFALHHFSAQRYASSALRTLGLD